MKQACTRQLYRDRGTVSELSFVPIFRVKGFTRFYAVFINVYAPAFALKPSTPDHCPFLSGKDNRRTF